MRIVVSGTHASGKSTLVSDFALLYPAFSVLPDPFELIDEAWDGPGASSFARQLRLSAARLDPTETPGDLIAERGPIDFLAYLLAFDALDRMPESPGLLARSAEVTRDALRHVDLVVLLPLAPADGISIGVDEDPALRDAMNDALLDLVNDDDIVDEGVTVMEITGDRDRRLRMLQAVVGDLSRRSTP
ncbi:ATP-binding protein [Herbiconiux moechotypicola]|uniref:NadR/Ttd14 AAA domain-containing protein n=1 Tax=Herbiconiux moechotypicola TaxID=637393 RepID=A0ABN3DBD6_9MICO|nr:ATP-binding protein [Herbiconiux moechotypicola]MCS5728920.1 ATP-binding protein [Herbiconiux moechotypicola]